MERVLNWEAAELKFRRNVDGSCRMLRRISGLLSLRDRLNEDEEKGKTRAWIGTQQVNRFSFLDKTDYLFVYLFIIFLKKILGPVFSFF